MTRTVLPPILEKDPAPRRPGLAASSARGTLAVVTRSSTPLPWLLAAYFVIAVGRIGDLSPWMQALPLAKIVIVLAIIAALRDPTKTAARTWKSIPPAKLSLLFMGIAAATMLFSVRHSATLEVIMGAVTGVTITLFLALKASRDWPSVKTMLLGIVIASFVLVILALSTRFAGRAGYTSSYDPNDFAFVLVGMLPVVFTFGIVSRGAKRCVHFAIAGSMVLAILLTESRGGLLALVWAIIAMIFLVPIPRRGHLRFRTPKSKVIARAILLVVIGAVSWNLLPDSARGRLESVTSLGSDYNTNAAGTGRMAIWSRNLPLVVTRPWGYGAGAFDTVDGLFAGGRYRAPHNTFLQALIELGIPGFAVFIAIIVSTIRYLRVPADAKSEDEGSAMPDEPRAFARGLGIGLVGLCISGFFLTELYANVLWTIVILSCAVGIIRRKTRHLFASTAGSAAAAGQKSAAVPDDRLFDPDRGQHTSAHAHCAQQQPQRHRP